MRLKTSNLVNDTNAVVTNRCQEVAIPLSHEDQELLLNMYQYVKDSQDDNLRIKYNLKGAVGLAANQVGVGKRLIVVVVDEHHYLLANPVLISSSVQKAYLGTGEGCLSVDDQHYGYVIRSYRVKVKGYDLLQDKEIEISLKGYPAIVMQHELDHLDGKLYYHRINKNQPFLKIPDAVVI